MLTLTQNMLEGTSFQKFLRNANTPYEVIQNSVKTFCRQKQLLFIIIIILLYANMKPGKKYIILR